MRPSTHVHALRLQGWTLVCLATAGAPGLSRIARSIPTQGYLLEPMYVLAVAFTAMCGVVSIASRVVQARGSRVPYPDHVLQLLGTLGATVVVASSFARAGAAPWSPSDLSGGLAQVLVAVGLAGVGLVAGSYRPADRSALQVASVAASGAVTLLLWGRVPTVFGLHSGCLPRSTPHWDLGGLETYSWTPTLAVAVMSVAWFVGTAPSPARGSLTHHAGHTEHVFTFHRAGPLARQRFVRRLTLAVPLVLSGLVGIPMRRFSHEWLRWDFLAGAVLAFGVGLGLDALGRLLAAAIAETVVRITPESARVEGPHGRNTRIDRRHLLLDITEDADGAILWVSHRVAVRADIPVNDLQRLIEPLRPKTIHRSVDVEALRAALGPLSMSEEPQATPRPGIEPVRADALGARLTVALAGIPVLFGAYLVSPGMPTTGAMVGWAAWGGWTLVVWGHAQWAAAQRRRLHALGASHPPREGPGT